jgi:hypothetical protein
MDQSALEKFFWVTIEFGLVNALDIGPASEIVDAVQSVAIY